MFLSGVTRSNFSPQVALHDRKRIACRPGLVDDERACRAAARRLLELVGPPAVVGHRRAVERPGVELRRVRGIGYRRIVDEHHQRLAFEVDALEVVPVVLGRGDAVADEDELRILDAGAVGDVLGPRDDVVTPLEGRACLARHHQRLGFGARDADERHLLDERAVGIARLEPQLLELGGQVLDRPFFTGRRPDVVPRTASDDSVLMCSRSGAASIFGMPRAGS